MTQYCSRWITAGGDSTVPTSVVFALPPPLGVCGCSNPSAAVLCHNSPEDVTWLVMKI